MMLYTWMSSLAMIRACGCCFVPATQTRRMQGGDSFLARVRVPGTYRYILHRATRSPPLAPSTVRCGIPEVAVLAVEHARVALSLQTQGRLRHSIQSIVRPQSLGISPYDGRREQPWQRQHLSLHSALE
ncbi:hypothetical protein M441DRAFT_375790 [Trichoderma asperellum CBS 433.97]|uniref:Secreted protein n=1 Tax=Trichoderma asperellum (strain ATCC 204424 / CBS 433.97 / NBRC 101777) TaxID=1042311 RepID=A0A2T3ZFP1_TRIA4|nr:hypothetical protein M441DRAFT_375790 [Trichoderma asperellum CBS 433.97]PTB43610.1 hypothetical protein M441DRAFT_375790 [Trichoderma asperellum CBS 433.97]